MTANHVAKLNGMANRGNIVFNAQMVIQGPKIIIATTKERKARIENLEFII
jgi:hypothetical protein